MKLYEFLNVASGHRYYALNENEKPVPPHEFRKRVRSCPEWDAEIDTIYLKQNTETFGGDGVTCIIKLR